MRLHMFVPVHQNACQSVEHKPFGNPVFQRVDLINRLSRQQLRRFIRARIGLNEGKIIQRGGDSSMIA